MCVICVIGVCVVSGVMLYVDVFVVYVEFLPYLRLFGHYLN